LKHLTVWKRESCYWNQVNSTDSTIQEQDICRIQRKRRAQEEGKMAKNRAISVARGKLTITREQHGDSEPYLLSHVSLP
jgi:hypothetical protein